MCDDFLGGKGREEEAWGGLMDDALYDVGDGHVVTSVALLLEEGKEVNEHVALGTAHA